MLVAYRQAVEHVAAIAPMGHQPVHQRDESIVVGGFAQMYELVNKDVFEALGWLFGQFGIESDVPRDGITAAPLRFHVLHVKVFGTCANDRFPLRQQPRHSELQIAAVPVSQQHLAFLHVCAGANLQPQMSVRQTDRRTCFHFDDLQQVTPSPDIVAFALQIFARRFPFLRKQLLLLLTWVEHHLIILNVQ